MNTTKIKKFFANRWVKIGGGVLLATGATLLTVHLVKKARDKKALNNNDGVFDNSLIPEIVDTVTDVKAGYLKYNDKLQYSKDSVSIKSGSKQVTFKMTKDAVTNMQKYFAKNATAKKMIEESGGYDGVVGPTFMKILDGVLRLTPDNVIGMRTLLKQSNVKSGVKEQNETPARDNTNVQNPNSNFTR